MITTSVMSYQFWHYIGFTARLLRFNIIIGHLLLCLHSFEGFMSGRLAVQCSCKRGLCRPQKWKGWGWKQLCWGEHSVSRSGRGRQTFKRAYCCSFHSGFDCLCFDLVWGGHVVQCYPPIISAISVALQWKRHWLGFTVCAASANIFTPRSKHESAYLWIKTGEESSEGTLNTLKKKKKPPSWFSLSKKKAIMQFFEME